MKDETGLVIGIGILLAIIMTIAASILRPEPTDDIPRIGDIWEHYGTGDPFKSEEVSTRRILDIKFGYVQYVEDDRDTLSRLIPIFKYNSIKLENNIIKKDSI